MNETWDWAGARWWRVDLHTHTPASADYGKGPDQAALKDISPRDWLLGYMRAEIDCVAVTDHNSGTWIDPLKEALAALNAEQPEGYRPLWLLPGVEITVNGGLHLLAIFDSSKTSADIAALLGAAGFHGEHGSTQDVTTKSFTEVATEVKKRGGLVIPAHVDRDSGLFTAQDGTTLRQALESRAIDAIEVIDPAAQKPGLYTDMKLHLPEVLGSDDHHLSRAGTRFTSVKMTRPELDGLRLALLDGPLSVRRSDLAAGDPNAHGNLMIEELKVDRAKYIGRGQPFALRLNPWLNAVIGGRGTGKSTLLEFLRITLRRDSEVPDALRDEWNKYIRVSDQRNDGGLLTQDTRLEVIYRKDGARYRIQWDPGGTVDPIQEQREDGWRAAPGDVKERFPVRIYSQKQIFELAGDPLALLRIVDEAPEVGYREWHERWVQAEAHYLSLRAKAREITTGLADEGRLKGELDDVARKLALFEVTGHAEALKTYQRRMRQQGAVDTWEESWSGAGDRLRTVANELYVESLDASLFDEGAPDDTGLLSQVSSVASRFKALAEKVNELAIEADGILVEWKQARQASAWQASVDNAVQQYASVQEALASAGAGEPSAYGALVQQRQMVEGKLKTLQARRTSLTHLEAQAAEGLGALLTLRRELTRRRGQFLQKVLGDNRFVRIGVTPYGARDPAEGELRRLLGREDGGFERDVGAPTGGGLLGALYAGYGTGVPADEDNVGAFEGQLAALKARLRDLKEGRAEDVQDRRFLTHVAKLPPESLDRLDCWFPEDSLVVEYSRSGDGRDFRPLQQGSPGQKTAALLAFLLSYGTEPIVLDQPEDDLDNHLIYELIVGELREIKQRRQVLVVTHNPNIVVNGDAELVVALDVRGGQTQPQCEGSLQEQEVRDEICRVMEGGQQAFEQRYRRILGEPTRVR